MSGTGDKPEGKPQPTQDDATGADTPERRDVDSEGSSDAEPEVVPGRELVPTEADSDTDHSSPGDADIGVEVADEEPPPRLAEAPTPAPVTDWSGARVAVLTGGESLQRDRALDGGRAIAAALREQGHDVVEVDATREGLRALAAEPPDVAFVAMRGGLGESGGTAGMLESLAVPYTGSGPASSARAYDKDLAKTIWRHASLPTPDWQLLTRRRIRETLAGTQLEALTPCVIKPVRGACGDGVTVVLEAETYQTGLERALEHPGPAMVEAYVDGRELVVALMNAQVMGIAEVTSDGGYSAPATLTSRVQSRVSVLAQAAVELLATRGVCTVELRVEHDGDPWLIELNNLPDFSPDGALFQIASATDLSFPAFADMMLRRAALDSDFLYD